jgi:molybdopterin biosynthesis enzyme
MAIAYTEALAILEIAAREIGDTLRRRSEFGPILEATSRIVSGDVHSPRQTPVFDSSAMDGYAVASACTRGCLMLA